MQVANGRPGDVTLTIGRSAVIARRGVVATGHPLATSAGLEVLAAGGNAVDSAVAIAGVLGVAQPILVDTARGIYLAGSDPRVDGSAIGL